MGSAHPVEEAADARVDADPSETGTLTRMRRGSGFLGAGLGSGWLLGILAISVAIFLYWDGPLWSALPGSTHVGRIAVSYAIVPPLIAVALLATARFRWKRLLSSLGLVWGVKLVVTATLYSLLAPGSTSQYAPSRAWQNGEAPKAQNGTFRYAAAQDPHDGADLSGTVVEGGTPVEGAIVLIERPPPGLPAPAARDVEWILRDGQHDQRLRLAWKGDRVSISNQDVQLHTVRFSGEGRDRRNVAVPSKSTARTRPLSATGVYELLCDEHAGEQSTVVIVDHPYAAKTDSLGRFSLRGARPGAAEVRVFRAAGPSTRHRISIPPSDQLEITLDVSAGAPLQGGNE